MRCGSIHGVVFDAYGTLLNFGVEGMNIAQQAGLTPAEANQVLSCWRQQQVASTWLRNSLDGDHYDPFTKITRDALKFSLLSCGVDIPALEADLMEGFRTASLHEDVLPFLHLISVPKAVLTNGDEAVVSDTLAKRGVEMPVLSASRACSFKPDRAVYQLACEWSSSEASSLVFVSSNAWDAFAASSFGFRVLWVNREATPRVSWPGLEPEWEVPSLVALEGSGNEGGTRTSTAAGGGKGER